MSQAFLSLILMCFVLVRMTHCSIHTYAPAFNALPTVTFGLTIGEGTGQYIGRSPTNLYFLVSTTKGYSILLKEYTRDLSVREWRYITGNMTECKFIPTWTNRIACITSVMPIALCFFNESLLIPPNCVPVVSHHFKTSSTVVFSEFETASNGSQLFIGKVLRQLAHTYVSTCRS
jgi:hypothetical protein